ncbi:MAG: bifunctional phosphoglucose/phosphomannose isomerase [Ignavibacteriaceae bacterium]|nr:bifunctional phosphoglucose/phosphomannose isomerase [Ignavibacteriaceae bacterium]
MLIKDFVEKFDSQDQFSVLRNSYTQIDNAWKYKPDLSKLDGFKFNQVIISGLGGSAIGGELLVNFLRNELSVPVVVTRNYNLPPYANSKTLVIACSYSGNTEETISVFQNAIKRECPLIVLTTGGKIKSLADSSNVPVIILQDGFQPRFALGTSFFSLLKVFQTLKLASSQDNTVQSISSLWKTKSVEYTTENNTAYRIAESLIGFIPVIYSVSDFTNSVGYRLKCQFNENSKMHAFHNSFPEMNHNEIVGWENNPEGKLNPVVISILDKDYHPQIKKRFEIVLRNIIGKNWLIINLESEANEFKVRLLDLIYLCDWITFYAAILRGFDPSEIDFINKLKEKLSN